MATVTAPIMTDATGQSIDSKLNSLLGKMDNLAAAFQPNASGIVYSNTTSGLTGDDVQEAIDEMAANVSEIKQSLSQLFKTKMITHNFKANAMANVAWNGWTECNNEDGYTPIGVLDFACNTSTIEVVNCTILNSSGGMTIKNITNTTVTNSFLYTVLYQKNL